MSAVGRKRNDATASEDSTPGPPKKPRKTKQTKSKKGAESEAIQWPEYFSSVRWVFRHNLVNLTGSIPSCSRYVQYSMHRHRFLS